MTGGRYTDAAADAAAALAQGSGPAALELAGWAAYYQRDTDTGRRPADDSARLSDDPAIRSSCLSLSGRARFVAGDLRGAEERLEEALRLAHGPALLVPSVWLGHLRVLQDRPEEALDLTETATQPGLCAANPFATMVGFIARGHALALVGRFREALAAFDALERERERRQLSRYGGTADNFRGWILRNLGRIEEADEANQRGFDSATYEEARIHALLDLADGRLQVGDLDGANTYVERVGPLREGDSHMFWRHGLRARLLGGRLALGAGSPAEAQTAALGIAEEASTLGSPRYVTLARLLEALACCALGEPASLEEVGALLEALPRLAPIEAWWLTAETAAQFQVDRWWELAERLVARQVQVAGPLGEAFSAHAVARFGRLRAESGRP